MKVGDVIELIVDLPPRFEKDTKATITEPRDTSFDAKYPHIPPSWYAKTNSGESFYFYEDEAKVIERSGAER